jgi:hypothetical protein
MIEHDTRTRRRAAVLPWARAALVAAGAAWLVGALPWLLDGMRLPISSGWPGVAPDETVRVALPFGEYHLVDLLVVTVVGGAAGVLASRIPRAFRTASAAGWAGATGALVGLALALAHTLWTVWPLLRGGAETALLVVTLVVLGVLGSTLGAAAGVGIVRRSWWSPVGAALLAACLGTWVVRVVVAVLGDRAANVVMLATPWVMATLVAGALVWTGCSPAWRWAWWPVVLGILWVVPAVFSAMYYVGPYARAGMGVGAGRDELVDATRAVLGDALLPSHHVITPYVVGPLVAIAVLAGLRRRASVAP